MAALTTYDAARHAVEVCCTVDEAKDIADKAAALKLYAKQSHDPQMELWVAEIRMRAKRRIGELSTSLETGQPRDGGGRLASSGNTAKAVILKSAGLSTSEAHRCEKLAAIPTADFESLLAELRDRGEVVTGQSVAKALAKRNRKGAVAERARENEDGCSLTDLRSLIADGRKFGTIYADPPWLYDNQATRASTGDHYVGLTVDQLCDPDVMPVAALAADDAHLHLWTTNAFLFDAPRIFSAWGFEFRSAFVWVKPQIGIGNYWRNSHEYLLTAIRGNAKRFNDHSIKSWGEFDRRQHSAKPEEIRGLIERASPGPYLELFGRRQAPGWTVWGNEVSRDLLFKEAA